MGDVAKAHGVTVPEMIERNREASVSEARKWAMYLVRKHTTLSLHEIADVFHRKHSTVHKAISSELEKKALWESGEGQ